MNAGAASRPIQGPATDSMRAVLFAVTVLLFGSSRSRRRYRIGSVSPMAGRISEGARRHGR